MIFYQEHTIHEKYFGAQTIKFVLSDTYDELFLNSGTEVDIFNLNSVNEKVNTEKGEFAMDELKLKINSLMCRTDTEKQALNFCLEALDVKKNRFCAIFFNPDYTTNDSLLASKWFIGKITNEYSGTDLLHTGSEYDMTLDPEREYEFTAYSFDIKAFESIKLTEKFEKEDATIINPIFDEENPRISTVELDSIFDMRNCMAISFLTDTDKYSHYYLGDLYDALSLILSKGSDILGEILNSTITIDLLDSEFGFKVAPATYITNRTTAYRTQTYVSLSPDINDKKELVLKQTPGLGEANPFIHRRMFDPTVGQTDNTILSQERSLSFHQFDSLKELISAIAKSFGAIPNIRYTTGSKIEVSFISKSLFVKDTNLKFADATTGKIGVGSTIVSAENQFYAYGTSFMSDGYDFIRFDDFLKTKTNNYEKIQQNVNDSNKDYKRLLLSTSYPSYSAGTHFSNSIINPLNAKLIGKTNHRNGKELQTEVLHTGIYLKVDAPAYEQSVFQDNYLWRFGTHCYAQVDGVEYDTKTLSDLINILYGQDRQYYESEYELTVPYWTGFKTDTDDPHWSNLELGSKIVITESNRQTFNIDTQTWEQISDVKAWVVVGIERNLQYPETKIKLHNLRRFAVTPSDGNIKNVDEYPQITFIN
jgi:hypothetical protein